MKQAAKLLVKMSGAEEEKDNGLQGIGHLDLELDVLVTFHIGRPTMA